MVKLPEIPKSTPEAWSLYERGGGLTVAQAAALWGPPHTDAAAWAGASSSAKAALLVGKQASHKLWQAVLSSHGSVAKVARIWPALHTREIRRAAATYKASDGSLIPYQTHGPSGARYLTEREAAELVGAVHATPPERAAELAPGDLPGGPPGGYADEGLAGWLLPGWRRTAGVALKVVGGVAGGGLLAWAARRVLPLPF